jgi:hypothetical protein
MVLVSQSVNYCYRFTGHNAFKFSSSYFSYEEYLLQLQYVSASSSIGSSILAASLLNQLCVQREPQLSDPAAQRVVKYNPITEPMLHFVTVKG